MAKKIKKVPEKGQCALCRQIIYEDDSGFIEYKEGLFCSVSCAEEATEDAILTGQSDETGYNCPYCKKHNDTNEGSSVALENGTVIITCAYCNKESISDEKV